MSNHVFKLVEKAGVPTHLIEELNDRETAVKKVEIAEDATSETILKLALKHMF